MSVDEYIQSFPENVRTRLIKIRETIKKNAPDAEEGFAYKMAAYKTNGRPLVYFAGFNNHIGFYAIPSGHSQFEKELSGYKHGKGSVQFPLKEPLPLDLIARIVKFRVEENSAKKPKKSK